MKLSNISKKGKGLMKNAKCDWEKIVLSVLSSLTYISIIYRYMRFGEDPGPGMIYIAGIVLGAFVGRKIASYLKPKRYTDLNNNKEIIQVEIKEEVKDDGSI